MATKPSIPVVAGVSVCMLISDVSSLLGVFGISAQNDLSFLACIWVESRAVEVVWDHLGEELFRSLAVGTGRKDPKPSENSILEMPLGQEKPGVSEKCWRRGQSKAGIGVT